MSLKAIIFDFDGTICNTGEGIMKSAKYALDSFEIPCGEWNELEYFIGPPLLVTFQEKFNQDVSQASELVKKFRERYSEEGVWESSLYDGISQLLKALKADGFKLGIASSKPEPYIKELLRKFRIISLFDEICGVSFTADCESKQSIISRTLDGLGVSNEEAIVVGDKYYDIDGAKANGVKSIGVLWGFGSKFELIECSADFLAEKPEDIEAIALGLFERTDNVQGIFSGRVITVHHDDVTLCNGSQAKRECVDHPGGVAVIGITDDDEVLLVRQFRYPYKEVIFEIPAGKLEKGEDPFEAGKREFKEECGAVADEYFSLGEVYPTPGYTNEIIRLYGAKGLHFEEQNLDEDEFLQICKMKFDTVVEKIMSGEIKDAKTIAATLKMKEIRSKE
ncbi:MAG: HAD hydrolase-like protein [Eubacterium sp.]|nr:HAD hydrolase-like protein [Eubacterium sp.]